MLSPLPFAIVVYVIMENVRELMNEIFKTEASESKGLKVNLKTKVTVKGSNGEVLKIKVDPYTLLLSTKIRF